MIWILAVGSDARPGETMTRSRGDAIQMVGINTRTGAASAIGIPRDSWVPIPGHGSNRVNAALYFGGPSLMGRTVGNLVGVQPDYVMVTRFPFFENMINDIGGIYVNNPRPFSDPYLKPKAFKQGRIKLDGYSRDGVLADPQEPGRRRLRPLGQPAAGAARHPVPDRGRAPTSPGFIERGVMTVMRNMDTNLAPAELFELAQVVAQVDPRKIRTCVVGGSYRHHRRSQHRLPERRRRPAATATPPAPTPPSAPADAHALARARHLCRSRG